MKFETNVRESVTIGDIKSNNVSIDTSNINFIVTILSTNLYSNPIESFIRETVSNGWDSHTEAGVDEPVVVELGVDTENKYFCAIRDFGVGLSPERFDKVYKNIGSSTKRDDNTQIGGFGIGRFSALSYSDVVYITSNFEGIKYKYIMYKDGNSISIDLLDEQKTEESNGLEVLVYLKDRKDVPNFTQAIKKQLVYFENLFVINNTEDYSAIDLERDFNSLTIKKYNNFFVNDLSIGNMDLVLGKVKYPLRFESLEKTYHYSVKNYPISLKFEVGDLEVTPNREEVLYTQKNIIKIQEVLDKALLEVNTLISEYYNKDFTVFSEYMQNISDKNSVPILKTGKTTVNINVFDNSLCNFSFKGIRYNSSSVLSIRNKLFYKFNIYISYKLKGNKLLYSSNSYSIESLIKQKDYLYISDISSLKQQTKDYIRETLKDGSIFYTSLDLVNLKRTYRRYYKEILRDIVNPLFKYKHQEGYYEKNKITLMLLKEILYELKDVKIISDSTVPESYLIARKEAQKAKRAAKGSKVYIKEQIVLHKIRKSNTGSNDIVTESTTKLIGKLDTYIKGLKVYGDRNSKKLRALYNLTKKIEGVTLYEIAATKKIMLENVTSFVELKDFLNVKYKIIRQIGTAMYIMEQAPHIKELGKISNLDEISPDLSEVVNKLSNYCDKYVGFVRYNPSKVDEVSLSKEMYDICKDNRYFDEETKALFEQYRTILEKAKFLIILSGDNYSTNIRKDRINLAVDYILARKLFRPSLKAVIELHESRK